MATKRLQRGARPAVRRGRRVWRFILLTLVILIILVGIGAAIWLQPYHASSDATTAERNDTGVTGVTVTQSNDYISFVPKGAVREGLIFYPGAKVEADAYAVYMRAIAERGYDTFIAKMPLNIALLAENRADEIIQAHPEIKVWAVGGHSLGGVAACDYVMAHHAIKGLLLYASYPRSDMSRQQGLAVVSISGTRDGLATPQQIDQNKHLLPASTQYVVIQGGIHSYFGDYGMQDGDGTATIGREQARAQILLASVELMGMLGAKS
jgi:hypothetical protein